VVTWSGGWGKAAVGVELFDKDSVLISYSLDGQNAIEVGPSTSRQ
jgi:hypothetical protein